MCGEDRCEDRYEEGCEDRCAARGRCLRWLTSERLDAFEQQLHIRRLLLRVALRVQRLLRRGGGGGVSRGGERGRVSGGG